MPNPNYKSEWINLDLSEPENRHLEVSHGLGSLPVLIRVLTKPLYGTNKDLIFEGM